MILTDARRQRINVGPANGSRNSVSIANVAYDGEGEVTQVSAICPVCDGPMQLGRYACSAPCSKVRYGRMTLT